jgi:putative addiction module antidote
MYSLKLIKIGNSLGVRMPKEMISELGVKEGAAVYLTKGPDGYLLSSDDPSFERQMKHAEDCMREYRDTFKELAK